MSCESKNIFEVYDEEVEFLVQALLTDVDGGMRKIVSFRGAESGLDHIEVTSQSDVDKENGIVMVHRIYSGERHCPGL